MNIISGSVRNKLLSVLALGAIAVSIIAGVAVHLENKQLNRFRLLLDKEVAIERDILLLNSEFKTQVQEWKNVLLRGHKPADLEKYWGRFQERKQSIVADTKSIIGRSDSAAVSGNLKSFMTDYQTMMAKYEEAYDIFIGDLDPNAADSYVRGIDRAPSKLLAETAKSVSLDVSQQTQSNIASSAAVERWALPSILLGQVIVLLIGTAIMNRNIVKPTKALIESLDLIKGKDFSQPVQVSSKDELGKIGGGLEEMRHSLVSMLEAMDVSAKNLTEVSDSVSMISGEIQRDSESIQKNVEHSATATNEMSASIQEVSRNASSAADSASTVNDNTEIGRQTMDKTITSMRALETDVEKTAEALEELESLVAGVGSVLDVIVGIAEQTNLLALNAAIEAARAGDQGRGFAVVADEVRTLAQKTQDSTTEIKSIIEAAQAGSEKAVSAMKLGVEQTRKTSQLAQESNEVMRTIKSEIALVSDMNAQIATAAEEQSSVAEEINRSVVEVSGSARNSSQQVKSASDATVQLMNSVNQLNDLVGQYVR